MAKFVVVYKGGAMGQTPEDQSTVMEKWMSWFGAVGSSITDMGNPFGESVALRADGSRATTSAALTGYTILEAESLDHAGAMASNCPVLGSGGSLEIYEAMPM